MTDTSQPPAKPKPPRFAVLASIALLVSGLGAMIGGLTLLANKDWVRNNRSDALKKIIDDKSKSAKDVASAKKNILPSELSHYVDTQVKASVVGSLVTLLITAFLAYAVYKGRHWSRWGVIGVWVLSTLTGSFVSLFVLLGFVTGGEVPMAVRVPVVLAGIGYLSAVVLTNLRPSVEYFALSRPDRGVSTRPPRSSLFGGRRSVAAAPSSTKVTAQTPAARRAAVAQHGDDIGPGPDRPRTKQRASADAVSRGADLARARAKAASKSRRTGS